MGKERFSFYSLICRSASKQYKRVSGYSSKRHPSYSIVCSIASYCVLQQERSMIFPSFLFTEKRDERTVEGMFA